jgi:hypothetical protein
LSCRVKEAYLKGVADEGGLLADHAPLLGGGLALSYGFDDFS